MARAAVPSRRLLVLLIATAVALMTIDARGFGPVQTIRRTMLSASQPVRDGLVWMISPVADGWQGAVHYDDVERENAELRLRLAELEGTVDQLPDTELQLEQVLEASDLDYLGDIPRVTGRVIADRRTGLERIVELDRGIADGVAEDMPVVTGQGLVGRVLIATEDRSIIRLISDPRFSVGVISPQTGAIGVTTGAGEGQSPIVDIEASSLDRVSTGARFETSGFDRSRYPGGIPVGALSVDEDRDVRTIELAADLDRLAYLTILLVGEAS